MRGQAIVAVIGATDRHGDHLALQLGKAAVAQHEVVGQGDERLELDVVEGIGLEHVGYEAKLFLALGEIGFGIGVEAGLGAEIEGHEPRFLHHALLSSLWSLSGLSLVSLWSLWPCAAPRLSTANAVHCQSWRGGSQLAHH